MTPEDLRARIRTRLEDARATEATGLHAPLWELVLTELEDLTAEVPKDAVSAAETWIRVKAAAARLGVPARWIYEHQETLPWVRRFGERTIRCSVPGIERWVASRPRSAA